MHNDLGTILGLILGTYAAIIALIIMLVHFEKTLHQPREQPRPATHIAPRGHDPMKPSTRELRAHRPLRTQTIPGRYRTHRHHTHAHATQ